MPGSIDFVGPRDRLDEVADRYPAIRYLLVVNGLCEAPPNSTIRAAAWRKGIELSRLLEQLNRAVEDRHEAI